MSSCFLHVDLDAFFASVEQLDNPQYRGKAVIVGGLPTDKRAVVSTCSYEARKYGVHSAMPISTAYKLCPNGIYLRGRMERYHKKSREVMKIFYDFSPDVKQMSVDEAFIDISGTEMLFGPPENVAKLLKSTVYEKTGLTVSVGVASNKYIAKIASGINKPDGLCYVPEGKEEDFMLSLPLSKLWGAGSKTQEKLKSFGFFTTKDIHNASLSTLVSLFGSCTGTFLHNAVRGLEVESFSDTVKSHSISAEETYSYDLTDIFTIETALLKLAYEVRFRLLDEEWHSKTLQVKIRYEDFTTVTVQNTFQRDISSLDDMYDKICKLFKSKYQYGKGIRLLGVGAQNLEKGISSHIQELFDFGEEKKQKLEETVLKIQKKNPSSEIKKARQLIKKGFLILTLLLSLGKTNQLISQEQTAKELFVEGDWEASLKQKISFNFQDDKIYTDLAPVVFTQKAALSLYFMYDKKWFLEAYFQDGFENNSILGTYRNTFENGIFTELNLGNKNINLSSDYGTTKIGKNISNTEKGNFGFVGTLKKDFDKGKNIKLESLISFDNLETHSKTWQGKYLFSNEKISISTYISRKKYLLPFDFSNITLFQQTSENNFILIDSSEYLFYPAINQIEFKNQIESSVALVIENKTEIENQLVDYIIQVGKWFLDENPQQENQISLEEYLAYLGIDSKRITELEDISNIHIQHFFTQIQGKDCLWLYKSGCFSLFENKNQYPVKISFTENIKLVSKYSDTSLDFENIFFLQDFDSNLEIAYNIESFENTESEKILNFAKKLFPLGNKVPLLYLLPSLASSELIDLAISCENYKLENSYNIGTNAVENSVVAYINGILTPCTYKKSTGEVVFSTEPDSQDKVQLFWKEVSKQNKNPTLFATTGFLLNLTPNLNFTSALSYSQPLLINLKTSSESLQSNLLTSIGFNYKKQFNKISLSASSTTGFEILNYNITNSYNIFSPKESISSNQKSYFQFDSIIHGNGQIAQIKNGKYELIAQLTENTNSSEITFLLPEDSTKLYESQGFYLESKISDLRILQHYNIYLEIGNLENTPARWNIETATNPENQNISTEFSSLFFPLTNLQKSKLAEARFGKIIFEKKDSTLENNISGNLIIKSFEYFNTGLLAENGVDIQLETIQNQYGEKIFIKSLMTEEEKSVKKFMYPLSVGNYKNFVFEVFLCEEIQDASLEIELLEINNFGNYESIFSESLNLAQLTKNQWNKIVFPINESLQGKVATLLKITGKNTSSKEANIEFYLGDIYLKDAKSSSNLVENLDFSLCYNDQFFMETQITGDFPLANIKKVFHGNFVNKATLDLSIFSINNQIEAKYQLGENSFFEILQGSHGFSTNQQVFKFLTLNENFSHNSEKESVSKENTLIFDLANLINIFPLKFKVESKINSNTQEKNNETLSFIKNTSQNQFSSSLKYENYILQFDINLLQKFDFNINKNINCNQIYNENYFYSYKNALMYQITPNKPFSNIVKNDRNLFEKKESFLIQQDFIFDFLSTAPVFTLTGENYYSKNFSQENQEIGYKIELPFFVKGNKFSLGYKENAKSQSVSNFENRISASIFKDFTEYFSNPVIFSLILPSSNTEKKILEITQTSEKILSSGKNLQASFNWTKNIFANFWDLFIPSSLEIYFGKDFKSSKINVVKDSNFLIKTNFTAFNIFGKKSALEFFNWYNQEDIINSLSLEYSNQKWNISLSNEINFYLDNSNSILHFFEYKNTIGKSFSLIENLTWSRTGKSSPLISIIKLIHDDIDVHKVQRFNSLDFSVSKDLEKQTLSQTYNIIHLLSLFFTENIAINTNISGIFTNIQSNNKNSTNISFEFSLGGKLVF